MNICSLIKSIELNKTTNMFMLLLTKSILNYTSLERPMPLKKISLIMFNHYRYPKLIDHSKTVTRSEINYTVWPMLVSIELTSLLTKVTSLLKIEFSKCSTNSLLSISTRRLFWLKMNKELFTNLFPKTMLISLLLTLMDQLFINPN
jgi:hypothetical protein